MGTLRTTGTQLALFFGCAALVTLAACTPRGTGTTAGTGAGGEGAPAKGDESAVSLSYSWWGGDNRTKLQNAVVDEFEAQNAGITFRVQTAGDTASHVERLAVQASGRNLPDLYQMQDRFIRQFSDGDSMRPLDDLVADGTIDVSDLPPEVLAAGKWGDKQLMIGTSFSFRGLYYNEKAFTAAGVEPPNPKTTWDQLSEKVLALHQAGLAKGSYAALNLCGSDIAFYSFLGGNDIKPYNGDQLGFTAADVQSWFAYWDKLAKGGAVPPAALQVEQQGNTTEDSMFAKKMVMVDIFPANQYETTREINPDTRVTGVPAGPKGPGNYLIVSGQSISGRTEHPKEAAKFIDFFLNDVEAAKTYKADNGLPAANKTREAVAQSLKLRQFELYDEIKDDLTQQEPAPPGSAEVISALERSCDELAFGRQNVSQAAEQFVAQAKQAIDRS